MKVCSSWSFVIIALGLLSLAGCSGLQSSDQVGPLGNSPGVSQGFPSVLELDRLDSRGSSAIGDEPITVLGDAEILEFNGAEDDHAHSMLLEGNGGGSDNDVQLAWGLYKVAGLNSSLDLRSLNIEATPGGLHETYYVGLANFTHGSWDWHGPSNLPEFQIDFTGDSSRYISELGNLYFLIITEHGSATHHQTTLTFGHHEDGHDDAPGAPHHLTATDGEFESHVLLTWQGGAGALHFEIWRRLDGSHDDYAHLATTEAIEYSDASVQAGQVYIYKVRAVNDAGHSSFSNHDSGFAGEPHGEDVCPTDLSASDGTHGDGVHLAWHGSAHSSYHVYRKVHGHDGEFELLGSSEGTTYNDESAEAGVTYIYKVSGSHADGSECFSNEDAGSSGEHNTADDCPTEFSASKGEHANGVALAWHGNHANTYDVYRRLDGSDGEFEFLAHADGLEYFDHSAEAGHVYVYKVLFTPEHGDHCWSNEDHGHVAQGEH
jgi:fibronectin type 3 domain-containing protein